MTWEDIHLSYPDRWIIIAVVKAHYEECRYVADELEVLNTFNDWESAEEKFDVLFAEKTYPDLVLAHGSRQSLKLVPPFRLPLRPRL